MPVSMDNPLVSLLENNYMGNQLWANLEHSYAQHHQLIAEMVSGKNYHRENWDGIILDLKYQNDKVIKHWRDQLPPKTKVNAGMFDIATWFSYNLCKLALTMLSKHPHERLKHNWADLENQNLTDDSANVGYQMNCAKINDYMLKLMQHQHVKMDKQETPFKHKIIELKYHPIALLGYWFAKLTTNYSQVDYVIFDNQLSMTTSCDMSRAVKYYETTSVYNKSNFSGSYTIIMKYPWSYLWNEHRGLDNNSNELKTEFDDLCKANKLKENVRYLMTVTYQKRRKK